MKIVGVTDEGKFDSIAVPGDPGHRTLARDITRSWRVYTGGGAWTRCRWTVLAGRRWDGLSRPQSVAWLIPRWGIFSVDSLFHDDLYEKKPDVGLGEPIRRKHADLLFFAGMMSRVDVDITRVALAESLYRAVWAFGEPTWNS